MNNKMITIPYADAIEYGENTSALFKALWELTDLIRLESDLKKHHRAYLHVREDIDEKVKEARQIMTKVSVDMIGFYFKVDVPKCSNSDENTPFADAADDETVSIPKGEYELMIDDLPGSVSGLLPAIRARQVAEQGYGIFYTKHYQNSLHKGSKRHLSVQTRRFPLSPPSKRGIWDKSVSGK